MAADRKEVLQRHWVHSHEEDTEGEMVFRPATHALPPSRGRSSFELRPDGSYAERSPGPVDVPEESSGSWSLEGNRLKLQAEGDRPDSTWQIKHLDSERLTVKPV